MFSLIHFLAGYSVGQDTSSLYENYTKLTDQLIFVVLSATMYQLLCCSEHDFKSPEQHGTLSVSFVVCIGFSLGLYYSFCFRLQHEKISKIFRLIETTSLSLSEAVDKAYFKNQALTDLKTNNIRVYFGIFASFMSAFLFSIQPLLRSAAVFGMDGKKQLQIEIWCPFNYRLPIVFEAVVIFQFFAVFWVSLRFFANDIFFMHITKTNIRFLKYLRIFGKEISASSLKRKQLAKHKKRRSVKTLHLKLLKDISEDIQDDTDEPYCDKDSNSMFDEVFQKQAEEKLAQFIRNHQQVLRCCQQVCQLYGPVMLMYLLSLMGFASVGAFGVLHTNGFKGVQSIAVSFFSIANLFGLYFMCKAGDDLSDESGRVAEALFADPWYLCSRRFRTSLVLVLQRVNTRVQACVLGVPSMPLSCTTFVWFTKTLVSFYLFLVNVQNLKNT